MRKGLYLFVMLVVLLTGIIVVVNSQSGPGFSKVYFDNATVPNCIVPNVTYIITFIIESHERSVESYHYTVYLNNTIIKEGKVSLAPNRVVQLSFNFSVKDATYRRLVLWTKKISYNLSGVWAIMGEPLENVTNSVMAISGYRLPAYLGPANLSFLINTTRNVTIIKTVEENSASGTRIKKYKLVITPLRDEEYRLSILESEFTYVPNSVIIKVVVEAANGKSYQILRRVPMEGSQWRAW